MKAVFLTDFDGTVTQDILTGIFKKYASPDWENVFMRYRCGEIGSRQLYQEIIPTLCIEPHELQQYLYIYCYLDPHFRQFLTYCNEKNIPSAIVSDGLDFYIQQMFKNADIYNVPVYSNLTTFHGNRLTVAFPPLPDDCPCGTCANCKVAICRKYRKEFPDHTLIYAGDGYSDRNVVNEVDIIFAKNEFAEYCRNNKISYIPFDDFSNILCQMKMLE